MLKTLEFLFVTFLILPQWVGASCLSDFKKDSGETLLRYAKNFEIHSTDDGVLVLNLKPAPGQNQLAYWFSKKPTPCSSWIHIRPKDKKLVALSGTHLTYLEMLNSLEKVVGVGQAKYIYNRDIHQKIDSGKTQTLGHPPQVEATLKSKADFVLGFATSSAKVEMGRLGSGDFLPVVYVSEFYEKSPLARAEWLKFVGVFVDEFQEAAEVFDGIQKQYQKTVKKIQKKTEKKEKSPTALVGSIKGGAWVAPSANSDLIRILEDAGARYVFHEEKNDGPIRLPVEKVFALNEDIDFWLPMTNHKSRKALFASHQLYRKLPFLSEVQIFNNTRKINEKGANDYWETAIVRPDQLIQEFDSIFWNQHKTKRWFEKLKKGED